MDQIRLCDIRDIEIMFANTDPDGKDWRPSIFYECSNVDEASMMLTEIWNDLENYPIPNAIVIIKCDNEFWTTNHPMRFEKFTEFMKLVKLI